MESFCVNTTLSCFITGNKRDLMIKIRDFMKKNFNTKKFKKNVESY